MNAIVLPEDHQAWAEAEVAAFHAPAVEQVVVEAVELRRGEIAWLQGQIGEAQSQLSRGDGLDGDLVLAELDAWIREDTKAES
jgi:hypothetical protein